MTTLRKSVILAGAALIALIIAADSYEAWQDHRAALLQIEKVQRSISLALAEQVAGMIQDVDLALTDFSEVIARAPAVTIPPVVLQELLRNQLTRLSVVRSATVVNADGHLLASTRAGDSAAEDWSQREVFIDPKNRASSDVYIGKPRATPHDSTMTIAISKAVHDGQGKFSGVVIARLDYQYLNKFYATVSTVPDLAIRLLRADGTVLASYPEPSEQASNKTAFSLKSPSAWESLLDKSEGQLVVHQPVSGYSLSIEVAQPARTALLLWRQQVVQSLLRTFILALLASLLIIALVMALRRRDLADLQRQRLEQQLRKSQQAETLGMFAVSIAHDFNNVLGAIVGYGEIAREALPPGASQSIIATNLERLLAASERARLLVRRILTFDTTRHVHYAACELQPVIHEVLQQITATLPAAVNLRTVGLDQAASIRGDTTEVHQVIMNLCANAVRAMPTGGTLELRLERMTITAVRAMNIGSVHPGEWLCLSVSDDGVGMSPETVALIFEPFFTTKQVEHGAGIGLAVTGNIVRGMGGAIAVSSEPQRGSRFSVYWPALSAMTADHTRTVSVTVGRGEVIMIVDDEASLVDVAEELLAGLGYEPVGFTDARMALQTFRRDPARFDAVLSDESMPELRGSDLARAIHAIRPELPFVLMTGVRDASLSARANTAGVQDILDKPLRGEQLKSAFARILI